MKKLLFAMLFIAALFGCSKNQELLQESEVGTEVFDDPRYITKEASARRYMTQGCFNQECPGIMCVRNVYYNMCRRPTKCKCLSTSLMGHYDAVMGPSQSKARWINADFTSNIEFHTALWTEDPETYIHPDSILVDTTIIN